MSSLFEMLESFWMEFLEHKAELVCFLSLTEGTEVIVDSINDDVWEDKDKIADALIDLVESWYWICL